MSEIKLTWEELTPEEKAAAITNYAAVRSIEEEEECDPKKAEEMTPFCKAFYKNTETGTIEVDI